MLLNEKSFEVQTEIKLDLQAGITNRTVNFTFNMVTWKTKL